MQPPSEQIEPSIHKGFFFFFYYCKCSCFWSITLSPASSTLQTQFLPSREASQIFQQWFRGQCLVSRDSSSSWGARVVVPDSFWYKRPSSLWNPSVRYFPSRMTPGSWLLLLTCLKCSLNPAEDAADAGCALLRSVWFPLDPRGSSPAGCCQHSPVSMVTCPVQAGLCGNILASPCSLQEGLVLKCCWMTTVSKML